MGHGLYNSSVSMGTPWVMDHTTVYILHDPWVVQWYTHSMGHGPYSSSVGMGTPWVMDRTTIYILHDPWVVQWDVVYISG